jgi:hypothetical protein
MDRTEQITALLRGELSDIEASELFNEMAHDEELRTAFNNYAKVDNTIKQNSEFRSPDRKLKSAVFSQIGIKVPAEKAVKAGLLSSLFSRRGLILTNAISLLILIGIAVFKFGYDSSINDDSQVIKFASVPESEFSVPPTKSIAIAEDGLYQASSATQASTPYIQPILKNASSLSRENEKLNLMHSERNINIASKISYIESGLPTESSFASNNAESLGQQTIFDNISKDIPNNEFKLTNSEKLHRNLFSKLRIEARSEQVKMIDDVTVGPKDRSDFDKLALSLLYEYSPKRSFGFNLKQETFYLDFRGTENGREYKYVMQPNLTGYELFWREKWSTYKDFAFYTNLALGANKVGMTIKPAVGIEYSPFNNISMLLGCESASMFYERDKQFFDSHKISLFYGISVGF